MGEEGERREAVSCAPVPIQAAPRRLLGGKPKAEKPLHHFPYGIPGRDNIKIKSVHNMVRQREGFNSASRRFCVPGEGYRK